jgi:hypothetical protein
MYERKEKDYFEFKSWGDFVDLAERSSKDISLCPHLSGAYRGGLSIRPSFQGVTSFQQALDLGRYGWKEGMRQSLEISDRLESKITGLIERDNIHYDITGELLDVGRYCAGEPEHWGVWQTEIVEGKGQKFLHLVCNGFVSCGIDKDIVIRRGATLAAFIRLAELGGYRVKVSLAFVGHSSKASHIWIALKDYGESLDQDKLVFALAHPASFRALGFTVMDTAPTKQIAEDIGIGCFYGSPNEVPEEEQGDVYMPCMAYGAGQWASEETAGKWLIAELKKQGVLKD